MRYEILIKIWRIEVINKSVFSCHNSFVHIKLQYNIIFAFKQYSISCYYFSTSISQATESTTP